MNICILGDGLTSLTLAKNLTNKKINVDVYQQKKTNNLMSNRTIGISKKNLDFFRKKIQIIPKKNVWEIKKIEIYLEKLKSNKVLNFDGDTNNLFYMVKNDFLYKMLEKELIKNRLFNRRKITNDNFYENC